MMNFNNITTLGESATVVKDRSSYGNNGVVNAATWTGNGKWNGGYSFNGTTSYIDVTSTNSLNITTGITMEAWIKNIGSNTNSSYVVKIGDSVHRSYGLMTVGKPIFWLSPDGTQTNRRYRPSTIDLTSDLTNWHYIVGTFSAGSGTHIFVDGVLTDDTMV